jgi:hypothetical protein
VEQRTYKGKIISVYLDENKDGWNASYQIADGPLQTLAARRVPSAEALTIEAFDEAQRAIDKA